MKLLLSILGCLACRSEPQDTAVPVDSEAPVDSCLATDEVCDGQDNDCDGLVDDQDPDLLDAPAWYADQDGDGFGESAQTTQACEQPSGHVEDATDCDDDDAQSYPGAEEIPYDGVDQDCDGSDLDDADGDGSPWTEDCDDEDDQRSPDLPEVCDDGVDNDCDETIDDDCQYFGGVVSADPALTIWGTREDEDWRCGTGSDRCGSNAGEVVDLLDFDGDGQLDLLTWGYTNNSGDLHVFLGPLSEDRKLGQAEVHMDPANYAIWLDQAAADLDGDGTTDLLIGDSYGYGDQAVTLLLGPDAGEPLVFRNTEPYAWTTGQSVAASDMDGDGAVDLLSTGSLYLDGSVDTSVYLSFGPFDMSQEEASFDGAAVYCPDESAFAAELYAGDLDSDGLAELLVLSRHEPESSYKGVLRAYEDLSSETLDYQDSDASLRWTTGTFRTNFDITLQPSELAASPSILVAGEYLGSEGADEPLAWLLPADLGEEGTDEDALARFYSTSSSPYEYASASEADFDDDGQADLLISVNDGWAGEHAGAAYVLFGPLSGSITIEEEAFGLLEGSTEPFTLCENEGCDHPGSVFGLATAAGDITGDGFPDIVIGAPGEETDTSSNLKGPGAVFIWEGGPGEF
jgi:hypothetical protein